MSLKMVRVEWDDSCSDDSWMKSGKAHEHTVSHCTSIGFLFKKDRRQLCLARDTSDQNSFGSLMSIPRKCVTRLIELKEK